jgi:hypothetical protein
MSDGIHRQMLEQIKRSPVKFYLQFDESADVSNYSTSLFCSVCVSEWNKIIFVCESLKEIMQGGRWLW